MTQIVQNIPSGYKQTEIGVIPEDWDVKKIEEVADVDSDNLGSSTRGDYEFKYIALEDISAGNLKGYSERVFHDAPSRARRKIQKGDVLFGTVRPNLKSHLLFHEVGKDWICSTGFAVIRCMKGVADSGYIFAHLFANTINRQIDSLLTGSNYPAVNSREVKNLRIQIPNYAEQVVISGVLSDADSLISKLESLIQKKKLIKQGAMQELLTGKRRLPGFSGEWKRKALGELGNITGSGVDKKIRPGETPVRLLNFLDVFHKDFIFSKNLNHQVTARTDQLEKCSVKKGDIFFTPSSEMPFDIGISSIAMEDMPGVVYSYHVDRFRLIENWDLLFRAYAFQTKDFADQTATHCEGSGKRYVLNLTTFRERLTIYYPTDVREQAEIAKILFDIDMEIEELESQLSKYQNIKQGMMQTLLTGKIRLI